MVRMSLDSYTGVTGSLKCAHTRIYIYICVCVCVCVYIYIYMYVTGHFFEIEIYTSSES